MTSKLKGTISFWSKSLIMTDSDPRKRGLAGIEKAAPARLIHVHLL